MSDKKIHIVAFDVPYPPDYGGAMDVYYRIKALHLLGYKIHLHCYEYGRGEQKALENITDKVYYYKRRKRYSIGLIQNLLLFKQEDRIVCCKNLLRIDHPYYLKDYILRIF